MSSSAGNGSVVWRERNPGRLGYCVFFGVALNFLRMARQSQDATQLVLVIFLCFTWPYFMAHRMRMMGVAAKWVVPYCALTVLVAGAVDHTLLMAAGLLAGHLPLLVTRDRPPTTDERNGKLIQDSQ